MQIDLTAEQAEFIRHAVDSGRFPTAEDAIREALALWIERERRREEILAAADAAEASLARGEGLVVTRDSMRQLAEDVNRRARTRHPETQKARR
jgi:putative addiction module CopG family antidote